MFADFVYDHFEQISALSNGFYKLILVTFVTHKSTVLRVLIFMMIIFMITSLLSNSKECWVK